MRIPPIGVLVSGAVGSGFVASGAVQGFFGAVRNIASGTIGVFDFGSGAVVAGAVGSGAVVSGNIASGQIGPNHLGSGAVLSGAIGSGQVGHFALSSGAANSGAIASGAAQGFFGATRNIASGTIGVSDFGSGAVIAGTVGSGAIVSGNVASGQIGRFAVSSGAITSGRLGVTGTPNGTNFLRDDFSWQPSSLPAGLFFSTANFAAAAGANSPQAGAAATGAMFAVDRPIKILGATWLQPLLTTLTVFVELWAVVGGSWTAIASVTVSPPTGGVLNTALFGSAVTANVAEAYAIVVYDGTNQLLYSPLGTNFLSFTQPGQGWTNGSNSAATIWGPGVWLYGYGYSTTGNTPGLLVLNAPTYTGLDLVYTLS